MRTKSGTKGRGRGTPARIASVVVMAVLTAFSFLLGAVWGPRLLPALDPSPSRLILPVALLLLPLPAFLLSRVRPWRSTARKREDLGVIIASIQPDVLLVVDAERNILLCNDSVRRTFGYEVEEVLGRKTEHLYFDRRTVPGEGREIYESLEQEGHHIGFATGRRKNGETLPLEIVTANVRGREGAVLLVRDITDRARADEELARHREGLRELVEERTRELSRANARLESEIAERRQTELTIRLLNEDLERRVRERTAKLEEALEGLKELDRMKDTCLSSISHELRTPLTSIRSFAEILVNYEDVSEAERRQFIHIIHSESERLSELIDDAMDLSKILGGQMRWNDSPFSLEEVVREVVDVRGPLLEETGLRVTLALPPLLPPVFADRHRLRQVLDHLVGNAIKFSKRTGGIRIAAETFPGRRRGDATEWVRVSVVDEGVGIEAEDLPFIFDRFRQGGSDLLTEKPSGTGLGLPICREIINHYGGNLWAESRQGEGSAFHFTLPAATEGAATSPRPARCTPSESPPAPTCRQRP